MSYEIIDLMNRWKIFAEDLDSRHVLFMFFIASTKTSTIPGISVAGPDPFSTLYTPTLDVEYLVLGKPRTIDMVPITPEGIPTPALITKAVFNLIKPSYLIVDSGVFREPKIPFIFIPHKTVGGRIDEEDALPKDVAHKIFEESRILGRMLSDKKMFIIIGESMPGGTTTAMSIIESLGFKGLGRTSSSSPNNPVKLKIDVFKKALARQGSFSSDYDVFRIIEIFGDPLHISITGFVIGALERESKIMLAGGTQMYAVLSILKRLKIDLNGKIIVGTTRWIVEDITSDIKGLAREISPEVPLLYTRIDFKDSPYEGLKYYEKGYVKEGVGAGGSILTAQIIYGLSIDEIKKEIFREYERLIGSGYVKENR